jgi:hypothetical protein
MSDILKQLKFLFLWFIAIDTTPYLLYVSYFTLLLFLLFYLIPWDK